MLDIDEMTINEIHALLQKVGRGHIGCSLEGHPYVVPMQYYFEKPDIYILTTVGMKTQYMDANPEICLQVEEIDSLDHWRSVTVIGRVEHITEQLEIDRIMAIVKAQNPARSPAINRTWTDAWGRENVMAIYRIYPTEMNGRTTEGPSSQT